MLTRPAALPVLVAPTLVAISRRFSFGNSASSDIRMQLRSVRSFSYPHPSQWTGSGAPAGQHTTAAHQHTEDYSRMIPVRCMHACCSCIPYTCTPALPHLTAHMHSICCICAWLDLTPLPHCNWTVQSAGVGKAAELACAGNTLGVCCDGSSAGNTLGVCCDGSSAGNTLGVCCVFTPVLVGAMCWVLVLERRKCCMGCVHMVTHEHSLLCLTVASSTSTALQQLDCRVGVIPAAWLMCFLNAGDTVAYATDRRLSLVYPVQPDNPGQLSDNRQDIHHLTVSISSR
jgi:hypothetical protein